MYPLLMEELARDRERALLKQAADRRLAAQALSTSARRWRGEAPGVGALRRVTGRALISLGNWVGGGVRSGAR